MLTTRLKFSRWTFILMKLCYLVFFCFRVHFGDFKLYAQNGTANRELFEAAFERRIIGAITSLVIRFVMRFLLVSTIL